MVKTEGDESKHVKKKSGGEERIELLPTPHLCLKWLKATVPATSTMWWSGFDEEEACIALKYKVFLC